MRICFQEQCKEERLGSLENWRRCRDWKGQPRKARGSFASKCGEPHRVGSGMLHETVRRACLPRPASWFYLRFTQHPVVCGVTVADFMAQQLFWITFDWTGGANKCTLNVKNVITQKTAGGGKKKVLQFISTRQQRIEHWAIILLIWSNGEQVWMCMNIMNIINLIKVAALNTHESIAELLDLNVGISLFACFRWCSSSIFKSHTWFLLFPHHKCILYPHTTGDSPQLKTDSVCF